MHVCQANDRRKDLPVARMALDRELAVVLTGPARQDPEAEGPAGPWPGPGDPSPGLDLLLCELGQVPSSAQLISRFIGKC